MKIQENEAAYIVQVPTGEYEVVIKRTIPGRYSHGKIMVPQDEDFGHWAWATYTFQKARIIFNEISSGERMIRSSADLFSEA